MHRGLRSRNKGFLIVLILVFGAVFLAVSASLIGLVVTQKRASSLAVASEEAFHIAEAGLDYYKWFLAHYPEDTTNGTTTPQPFVHRYEDPETGETGEFELTVTADQSMCGHISAIDITSVGRTDREPNIERTIFGRYAKPTIAEYSYILDANVLIGSDHDIYGPYHSNGGINMRGTNNSTMSSALETWDCNGTGCSGSQIVPGVTGTGPNDELWEYPVPPINFAGILVDLADMKTSAIESGLYFGDSGAEGYHVILKDNSTFDLYRVTGVLSYYGHSVDTTTNQGWALEENIISTEVLIGNYAIPDDCALIFFEDQERVWLEGEVSEKMTLAVASPADSSTYPSIIILDDIVNTVNDGTVGLLAIAEDDVLIGVDVPDYLDLYGIFVAQEGAFRRRRYCVTDCALATANTAVPSGYGSYVVQTQLSIHGTIVSKGRVYSQSTCSGAVCSGFRDRVTTYDTLLVEEPPPLTPSVSPDYEFTEWREIEE